MTKKTVLDVPKIAVDTDIMIALTVYERYGQEIRKTLESNNFSSSAIEGLVNSNYNIKKEFGFYSKDTHTNEKLEYIARLYQAMRQGLIDVYITQTVLGELGLMKKTLFKGTSSERLYKYETHILDFIQNPENNITVLTVPDEEKVQFAMDKLTLAKDYVEIGAMSKVYDPVLEDYRPSTDAYIMAEASLFGLFFITLNEKYYIHLDCYADDGKGDYKRSELIQEINTKYGLRFNTNKKPYKDPPKPIELTSFINRFKHPNRDFKCFFTYPNIDPEIKKIIRNALVESGVIND